MKLSDILAYLGIAFILCALGRLVEWSCTGHGKSAGKLNGAVILVCYGLAFPVYGALHALESAINKRWSREYDEAIKAAAMIAAIEALPEHMREEAWQRDAWREWHDKMSYNEWYNDVSNKYGFDDLLFFPSTSARWEIERLCNELKMDHKK